MSKGGFELTGVEFLENPRPLSLSSLSTELHNPALMSPWRYLVHATIRILSNGQRESQELGGSLGSTMLQPCTLEQLGNDIYALYTNTAQIRQQNGVMSLLHFICR